MSACDFNLDRVTAIFTLAPFKLLFDKSDPFDLVDVVFSSELIEDLCAETIEDSSVLIRSDFKGPVVCALCITEIGAAHLSDLDFDLDQVTTPELDILADLSKTNVTAIRLAFGFNVTILFRRSLTDTTNLLDWTFFNLI